MQTQTHPRSHLVLLAAHMCFRAGRACPHAETRVCATGCTHDGVMPLFDFKVSFYIEPFCCNPLSL